MPRGPPHAPAPPVPRRQRVPPQPSARPPMPQPPVAARMRKPPALQLESKGVSSRGMGAKPAGMGAGAAPPSPGLSSAPVAGFWQPTVAGGAAASAPRSPRSPRQPPMPRSPGYAPVARSVGAPVQLTAPAPTQMVSLKQVAPASPRSTPGPWSPEADDHTPPASAVRFSERPGMVTPPPRTSSLSPQNTPPPILRRSATLSSRSAGPPPPRPGLSPETASSGGQLATRGLRKMHSQPQMSAAQPNPPSRSTGQTGTGYFPAPTNEAAGAESTGAAGKFSGRSSTNRWRARQEDGRPSQSTDSTPGNEHPPSFEPRSAVSAASSHSKDASARLPPTGPLPQPPTERAARPSPSLSPPRCHIPPPPSTPPPAHLLKARQQQQQQQTKSPGGSLTVTPLAAGLTQSASAPNSPSPVQTTAVPPMTRAASPISPNPVLPAAVATSAGDWERRPLGSRALDSSKASGGSGHPQPPPSPGLQRGWKLRAAESDGPANAPSPAAGSPQPCTATIDSPTLPPSSATVSPGALSPLPAAAMGGDAGAKTTEAAERTRASVRQTILTKTCDKCNGTGTRSIAVSAIGPTTAGNSVCSRCRGRGKYHLSDTWYQCASEEARLHAAMPELSLKRVWRMLP
ncbi:hypothetical protein THASP1DRAFT_24646 [Thamnocephalis sphaerospora]|uniref:Uncharacterized protein n=1 Tax=Thamnocephalis sphaerospora TaxID=78915 RepID=A0A4V1IWD2_9FUNG|nr:hypothetical protein THASP1DRAFT_24646 [Thamnocephalis sphaerospora]|eukprot:RKP07149.1 hypothetical protein THASP1DRAFT_24646 [Thamnocephalis sphaerospora]